MTRPTTFAACVAAVLSVGCALCSWLIAAEARSEFDRFGVVCSEPGRVSYQGSTPWRDGSQPARIGLLSAAAPPQLLESRSGHVAGPSRDLFPSPEDEPVVSNPASDKTATEPFYCYDRSTPAGNRAYVRRAILNTYSNRK